MNSKKNVFALAVLVMLALAGTPSSVQANRSGTNDEGTKLSITASSQEGACNPDGTRTVNFDATVISTAAADEAIISVSVGGGAETAVGSIPSGNVNDGGGWSFAGRTKTGTVSFDLDLAPGSYYVTICATQHGSQGRLPKRTCTTIAVIVGKCEEEGCPGGDNEARGEITASPNAICGKDTPVNVHFHGNFGNNATVTVDQDNVNIQTIYNVDNRGESCEYIVQALRGIVRVPGTYRFTIDGNNQTASATVVCPAE